MRFHTDDILLKGTMELSELDEDYVCEWDSKRVCTFCCAVRTEHNVGKELSCLFVCKDCSISPNSQSVPNPLHLDLPELDANEVDCLLQQDLEPVISVPIVPVPPIHQSGLAFGTLPRNNVLPPLPDPVVNYKEPPGWDLYSAFGKPLADLKIIASKTPVDRKHGEEGRLTPSILLSKLEFNRTPAKSVIDLTNTMQYYNPCTLTRAGVFYNKVAIPGHGKPPERNVQMFCIVLEEQLNNQKDGYVIIHCSQGLNRTGYMLCRYLMMFHQYTYEEAIAAFEESRGYPTDRKSVV